MESREQFEHQCRNGLVNGGLAVFENGVYVSELTRAVWSGWQASRSSIELNLTSEWDISSDGSRHYDADSVDEQLLALGIKVKK